MAKRKRRAKKLQELPIQHHLLMCKHTKISEAEKKQLFEQFALDLSEMPKIRVDDPALNTLGAQPGDIIKIFRKSHTAGETTAYRVVIDVI